MGINGNISFKELKWIKCFFPNNAVEKPMQLFFLLLIINILTEVMVRWKEYYYKKSHEVSSTFILILSHTFKIKTWKGKGKKIKIMAKIEPGKVFKKQPSTYLDMKLFFQLFLWLLWGSKRFIVHKRKILDSSWSTLYPENVYGLHLNMLVANSPGSNLKSLMANIFPAWVLDAKDYWKILNVNKFKQLLEETGQTFG